MTFLCPRCSGHHFGTTLLQDSSGKLVTPVQVVLYECQSGDFQRFNAPGPRKWQPCGWTGTAEECGMTPVESNAEAK